MHALQANTGALETTPQATALHLLQEHHQYM